MATVIMLICSLRSQLAWLVNLLEDMHSRDESREMATVIMATSTTKLTHPIRLTRSFRSSFFINAPRFARRSVAEMKALEKGKKIGKDTALDGIDVIEEMTKKSNKEIDDLVAKKESEVLKV